MMEITPHRVTAVLCTATWLVSLVVHLAHRRTGRIQLRDDDGLDDEETEALRKVQDTSDGEVVDQPGFVRLVQRSRTAVIMLAVLSLLVCAGQLARVRMIDVSRLPPTTAALTLVWLSIGYFATYGLRHVGQHWSAVVHLASLSLVATVTNIALIVIPEAIRRDDYVVYALHAILSVSTLVVVVNIPSGARRIQHVDGKTVRMSRQSHKGKTVLSQLWFTDAFKLVLGARRKGFLDEADVPLLGRDLDAGIAYAEFRAAYTKSKPSSQRSLVRDAWPLMRALLRSNAMLFIANQSLALATGGLWYVPSFVTYRVVKFLEEAERDNRYQSGADRLRYGLQYALLLVSCIMLCSLLMGQLFSISTTWLRNRLRTQLQVAIFTKSLRRKEVGGAKSKEDDDGKDGAKAAPQDSSFTKSQVINLVSVDSERISNTIYLITLCMAPVEICVGGFFAIYLLRWAALVGLLASLAVQPIMYFVGKIMARLQSQLQSTRDRKVSLLTEAMQSIRMVKFNAWEDKAARRIQDARDEELRWQKYTYWTEAGQTFLTQFSPTMMGLVAFGWYVFIEKKELKPSIAFSALAVLDEMRFALTQLPDSLSKAIQSLVSLQRIQHFLQSEEVDVVREDKSASDGVVLRDANIAWPHGKMTADPTAFHLIDVSVRFTPRALNIVVGRLGSGKTLLLLGLLGEADVAQGYVTCPRSRPNSIQPGMLLNDETWLRTDQLAYVPQTAFLVNSTLKNNVLFGLPLLADRYEATLDACGLRPDLKLLEDGDETEIGENGIGLSGGQTIRVMLARAVYGRAQTLLLDDPLSAVDAHTAAHIHASLLRGPLCADRTVILVTHQVQLVAQSSANVVMLDEGKVVYQGEPLAFMQSDLFSGLIEEQEPEKGEELVTLTSTTNTPNTSAPPSPRVQAKDVTPAPLPSAKPRTLIQAEERAKGNIMLSIYAAYVQAAGGVPMALLVVTLLITSNSTEFFINGWLQYWTSDVLLGPLRHHTNLWWMLWWVVFWLSMVVLRSTRMVVMSYASLRASRVLFQSMLNAVLRAPLRFHDTISRGRLLNRFGYDFEEMDSEMVAVASRTGNMLIQTLACLVAITLGAGWPFLLFFAALTPFYVFVGRLYMTAARDLKRLASTTRSPILNTFGDVVRGSVVVRAFGASDYFFQTLCRRINDNTTFNFWVNELRWWYEQMYISIGFIIILAATVFVLLNTAITASQAGFVFSFLINIHIRILFLMQGITDMERKLVSVERIVEYSMLDGEKAVMGGPVTSPPAVWPAQGHVKFTDLHVRYAADLPNVLNGVSFDIPAGAKVGIVGPTGCGKSTLASSFFRFVDVVKGSIEIDGYDIANVDLTLLRSRLQIVPQDPTIFSGAVRSSLDVFDEYSDGEIREALKKVQLIGGGGSGDVGASSQRRDFSDLSFAVAEGGTNLSNGEKQLLCLARAILRRCKLIVFDEATSSVDFDTDAIISQTIRQAFEGSTIVTIAHRLRTIIDYDLVLVMDAGKVVEIAPPAELLRKTDSRFYKLCRATGKRELAHLKQAAGL